MSAESGTAETSAPPVLEVRGLTKHFPVHARGRARGRGRARVVRAVEELSLALYAGEVTALVGESGSGKSTVGRLLAQLHPATAGSVFLRGAPARSRRGRQLRRYLQEVQLILQDPFSSLNPTHTIAHHLERPLRLHHHAASGPEATAQAKELLRDVNLLPPEDYLGKFPHELSGGQRQRVAIARALAARPAVLLADEPVSMLDVSIRLGILNLFKKLIAEHNLALLYITHDIASARYFASTTLVMYAGQLIEGGPSEVLAQQPAHPYAQLLIRSAPDPARDAASRGPAVGTGEPPSLISPPLGCRFHPRCPHVMDICRRQMPDRAELADGHWVRCWLHPAAGENSVTAPAQATAEEGDLG